MNHRDYQIILKIIGEINTALKFINDLDNPSFDSFSESEITKRAVCMTVINIGELIKSVSEETRGMHKDIPWKEAAGFRDIAAHKYQTLKMEDVYVTVINDFPALRNALTGIINQ